MVLLPLTGNGPHLKKANTGDKSHLFSNSEVETRVMDEIADDLHSLLSFAVIILFFSTEPWSCAKCVEDRSQLCVREQ